MDAQLIKKIKEFGKVRLNEPFSKHTTFQIGGEIKALVRVENVDKLPELLKYLDSEGANYMILGGGSNMLASDQGFDGVVIQIQDQSIEVEGERVVAAAGATTVRVAQESVRAGLRGFEWGVGVPGTIGGAVRGNAGAMGKEMKDDLEKVLAYVDGEVVEMTNEECDFHYRHSIFKENSGVVLKVWLKLKSGDGKEAMKKALEALKYRNETQPKGFASTGCIFKNVDIDTNQGGKRGDKAKQNREALLKNFDESDEKVQKFLEIGKISAGWLVEQSGLKGTKYGKAEVSPVHGNFIVSIEKGTTSEEVMHLIEQVKEEVYNKYGITLEEEIFVG